MTGSQQSSGGGSAHETPARYVLQLYVTGATPRSRRAVANLTRICEMHLYGRYDLEIIDIYQHPERTREQQVIAAPTLVKLLPEPLRRIIGDLSESERVLSGLDLLGPPVEEGRA